jgi:hypothetical protein
MIEKISVNKTINVSGDRVWAAIRNIGGLERWFPIIAACRVEGDGVGAIRFLGLVDGRELRDRIEEIDDSARRFRYLRTHHPLPVSSYKGVVLVRDAEDGKAEAIWTVEIEVAAEARDDVAAFIRSALSDGLDGLSRELDPEHPAP